ncbi:PAP2 superfamily protein [Colletotrichum higginsianum]|uniref:PAP2 superfamily protein n=1 Tax=Colletotrichum higginsianum (strain IMI 349063) TaxID=759273 RepID=H1V7C7_COLHI|nr:PAP2 superfamily protein [Colletotrichum higginsianum]
MPSATPTGGGKGGDKPDKPDKPGKNPGKNPGKTPKKKCAKLRMKAKGTVTGWIGQLESGQLRIGLKPVNFRLENGQIVDSKRRGMWWTRKLPAPPPFYFFPHGHGPWKLTTPLLSPYRDAPNQTKFFQCEADNQTYNLYKKDDQGVNCGEVTLHMTCGRGGGEKPPGEMPPPPGEMPPGEMPPPPGEMPQPPDQMPPPPPDQMPPQPPAEGGMPAAPSNQTQSPTNGTQAPSNETEASQNATGSKPQMLRL